MRYDADRRISQYTTYMGVVKEKRPYVVYKIF